MGQARDVLVQKLVMTLDHCTNRTTVDERILEMQGGASRWQPARVARS